MNGTFRSANQDLVTVFSINAWPTSRDNFNLYNAILINDIVGGLFQINGSGNIIYQNVTETNGLSLAGAQPFINKTGTINLLGKNQFNILANTNKQFAGDKTQNISSYNSLLGNDEMADGFAEMLLLILLIQQMLRYGEIIVFLIRASLTAHLKIQPLI